MTIRLCGRTADDSLSGVLSDDYGPETYGERIADVYDDLYQDLPHLQQAVDTLTALARRVPGPALELGIGTGRLALPLAARGVDVHGVDASPAMVARLRAKPGGESIPVAMGDFAYSLPTGPFSLVYVAFNTFFSLSTQREQVGCFGNVADRLLPGGTFALEAFVPDLTLFDRDQRLQVSRIETGGLIVDASRHDRTAQTVTSQHVVISEEGIRLFPVQIRYAWPSELDLMALLAGLRLRERWDSWSGEPFGSKSDRHVSFYERA